MSADRIKALIAAASGVTALPPHKLQAKLAGIIDPVAKLADTDFCEVACSELAQEYPGVSVTYHAGSLPQESGAPEVIRWLVDGLTHWKPSIDTNQSELAALLLVFLSLGNCKDVWEIVGPSVGANSALLGALEWIVIDARVTIALAQEAGIYESETLDGLRSADTARDWKTAGANWPRLQWAVYNPVLRLAVRGLMQCDPDGLVRACQAIDNVFDGMLVAQELEVEERVRIADRSTNRRVCFYLAFSALSEHPREPLSAEPKAALARILIAASEDPCEWTSWLNVFVHYPTRYPAIHPSVGIALATVRDVAANAFVDAIELDLGYASGREAVASGLEEFRHVATLDRRRLLWGRAFRRWQKWAFARDEEGRNLTRIARTELDYAIVGYCLECITDEERRALLENVLSSLKQTDSQWHSSAIDMIASWFRALSMLQPICHAEHVKSDGLDWLATSQVYLPHELNSAYARLQYGDVVLLGQGPAYTRTREPNEPSGT